MLQAPEQKYFSVKIFITSEIFPEHLSVQTPNVVTSIFGVVGFFVSVSERGSMVWWVVGESLLFNSKIKT